MSYFYTLNHGVRITDAHVEPMNCRSKAPMEDAVIDYPNSMFRFDEGYNCLKVELKVELRDLRDFVVGRKATSSRLSIRLRLERGDRDDDDRVELATKDIVVPAPHASTKITMQTYMSLPEGALTPGHYCFVVTNAADGAFEPFPDAEFLVCAVPEDMTAMFRPINAGFGNRYIDEDLERSFPNAPVEYHLVGAGYGASALGRAAGFDFNGLEDDDDDEEEEEETTEECVEVRYDVRRAHFLLETTWENEEMPLGTIVFSYADGSHRAEVVTGCVEEKKGERKARFSAEDPRPGAPEGPIHVELRLFGEPVAGFVGEKTGVDTLATIGDFRGEHLRPLAKGTIDEAMARLGAWKKECAPAMATMAQLERMVGLGDVKEKLTSYMNLVRFHKMRAERGISSVMPPLHALFLGSPGTGKTTVAQLMGRLMREAGVLSKGHVVVRERSQIVGRHYGDETEAMRKALEEAEGGVLFIDEAYTLYREADPKDPGREAIEALLSALADSKKRNWMLILGGYEDKILKMFEMNPGLASRFPKSNYYRFADYSAGELMEIAVRYCEDNAYELSAGAREKLAALLAADVRAKDAAFGNARHVLNILETEVFPAMAARVSGEESPSEETLMRILAEDIPATKQAPEPRRRLGFRA